MRGVLFVCVIASFIVAAVLIGALVSPYLLGTAATPPRSMSAEEANAVLTIVRFEQTAVARRATLVPQATPVPAGPIAVYVVGVAPSPTTAPFPRKPTPTAFPSCPQPGAVCQWPQPPAAPDVEPSPTPYPTCVTPVPGKRCQDVARVTTPESRCWSAGWGRRVCWPPEG